MALFSLHNLSKVYRSEETETYALRDISFSVEPGEFVAIMGPSGSGKSTLLHILGFLERQSGGSYRFDGKTLEDYSEEEMAEVRNKKMGFVFQAFNLLSRTSVLENVKLPLVYAEVPVEKRNELALKAIEAVGLSHRISHEPSQLSGGEKQRVAIARALVNRPSVIFADEPTGNLDSKSGQLVMEVLQRLHEVDGHTIILITHETETAQHAQRIIRIKDGIVESDKKVMNSKKATDSFKK